MMGRLNGVGGLCCGFFFQAEDGIRDSSVTGVQTCALPICSARAPGRDAAVALVVGMTQGRRRGRELDRPRASAIASVQRAYGNQAVLRMLDPQPSLSHIQRKPVPKLLGGRVRWYDSDDLTQQLFDTEAECAANASAMSMLLSNPLSGLAEPELMPTLPGGFGSMSLSGPVVKTWQPEPP